MTAFELNETVVYTFPLSVFSPRVWEDRFLTRSSYRRCSMKKGGLKNFARFTGKHLRQNRFDNKISGLRPS